MALFASLGVLFAVGAALATLAIRQSALRLAFSLDAAGAAVKPTGQTDAVDVLADGAVHWRREVSLRNGSNQLGRDVSLRFPPLCWTPFSVVDEKGTPARSTLALENGAGHLTVHLPTPLLPGAERRLLITGRARAVASSSWLGSAWARVSFHAHDLTAAHAASSLKLRLPVSAREQDVHPCGVPWDELLHAGGSVTLIWRDVSRWLPADDIGVELPSAAFSREPTALLPARPVRLASLGAAALGLVLFVLLAAWRAPPSWHTSAILAAMALQFLLFFQPILLEDNLSYLAYVRSVVLDGDLDLAPEYRIFNAYGIYSPNPLEPVGPSGASVMLAPFFLAGALLRDLLDAAGHPFPANGFSLPYIASVGAGGFFYVTCALLLAYQIAASFARPRAALLATLAAAWATNLMLVAGAWSASTHAPSCFLVTAFVWHWLRTRENRTHVQWGLLGLLGGLATQTRYQNGLFLLLPLLDAFFDQRLRPDGRGLSAYAAGALLGSSTQWLVWSAIHGAPLVDNYGVGRGRFTDTWQRLGGLLLGRRRALSDDGLFVAMPVMAIAWLGLLLHLPRGRPPVRILALMLAGQLAIVASYDTYWGRLLYGSAYLLNCTSITVLGLALALERCPTGRKTRLAVAAVLLACCIRQTANHVAQQAFEQLPRSAASGDRDSLLTLCFLPRPIETGYERLTSGEFGHAVRELVVPGGEPLPILAVAGGLVALAGATAALARVVSTAQVLGGLALWLILVDIQVVAAARGPRALAWKTLSLPSKGAVYRYEPLSRATGFRSFGPIKAGRYHALAAITHLIDAAGVPDGELVAEIVVRTAKDTLRIPIRAGQDTAEVAYSRAETRAQLQHRVPISRLVHQWRSRDGSSSLYWAGSFARIEQFGRPVEVRDIEVHPQLASGFLCVPRIVLLGSFDSQPGTGEEADTRPEPVASAAAELEHDAPYGHRR